MSWADLAAGAARVATVLAAAAGGLSVLAVVQAVLTLAAAADTSLAEDEARHLVDLATAHSLIVAVLCAACACGVVTTALTTAALTRGWLAW